MEDLDVKVFLVCDVEDMAWCVYQICLQTLLSSERAVWDWLDRDGFSVLPTEEEKFLVRFPCVNSATAQLMLRRAPSLQWLLGASFSDLRDAFPEIPHKVCKLFSHITTLHRLSVPRPSPQSDDMLPAATNSPGFAQLQDAHWFGKECGAAVGQSEGVWDSDLQPWPGQHSRCESYAGPFEGGGGGGGEEQQAMDASSLPEPNLSAPAEGMETLPSQKWNSSGVSSRGQQSDTYSVSPQHQREKRRPASEFAGSTAFPHCKRAKLLYERIPGRCDGQTRLRFF